MTKRYRAKCGWCDGKGYVTPLMQWLHGDCQNCKGTGWIDNLTVEDVAWFRQHDPDRLYEVSE